MSIQDRQIINRGVSSPRIHRELSEVDRKRFRQGLFNLTPDNRFIIEIYVEYERACAQEKEGSGSQKDSPEAISSRCVWHAIAFVEMEKRSCYPQKW